MYPCYEEGSFEENFLPFPAHSTATPFDSLTDEQRYAIIFGEVRALSTAKENAYHENHVLQHSTLPELCHP